MAADTVEDLRAGFEEAFGALDQRIAYGVYAPGRTEIAGNHTDHEGGSVIAAAVNRYVRGIFAANNQDIIRVVSAGYGRFELKISELAPRQDERETTISLVRGMAACMRERGISPQGFDAYIASDVPAGSGISSSAAFELALGRGMAALWCGDAEDARDAEDALTAEDLAVMAQRAEREWFGKPCGLMDQAASSLGGIQHMSFAVPNTIDAQRINFDFEQAGYAICIIEVGADHAANTAEYASVPGEMQAVARELGCERLGELNEDQILANSPLLRSRLGDRPVLRALHYYREERLVDARTQALAAGDIAAFLELERLSGASSAMYLQNVSVAGAEGQPTMLALAVAEELLAGSGAVRVHGGGFGGTIQAFVPLEHVESFTRAMNAALGYSESDQELSHTAPCSVYVIDHKGARAWKL